MKYRVHTDLDDLIIEFDTDPPEKKGMMEQGPWGIAAMVVGQRNTEVPRMVAITFFYRDVPLFRSLMTGHECMMADVIINAMNSVAEAEKLMKGEDDATDAGES